MTVYRVRYSSITASYGPSYIEAENAQEAKRKFAKGAFSQGEMTLITATPVSLREVMDALEDADNET